MRKNRLHVKVCCIGSVEEARLAISAGASAVGLVSSMPSGPGIIDEERIAEIAAAVPPSVATFLLTCKTTADEIIIQQNHCRANTLQLVDWVTAETHQALRAALTGISLVQVIHVLDESSVTQAIQAAQTVDFLLLDSGNPGMAVKELGGTGRTHDWSLSARIVKESPVPVYLAGGLIPENVALAVQEVRPYGVDVCSGVRTDGELDGRKLQQFLENASRLLA